MKPDKHFTAAMGVIAAAVCLIALTWIGTTQAIYAQRLQNITRVTATLTNQALTFSEQINRQILGLEQTLRILVTAWEADPRGFNLESWRSRAVVLDGLSRDMILTDENGIIRQSSVAEAINQDASGQGYFRVLADPADPGDRTYIGPATIDGLMRQWHMNVARSLHQPDGSFAGVIDADYRIAAITDIFGQTNLGTGAFVTLAGLDDGKLRGAVGPATVDPDANVSDTPMFTAIRDADNGVWTGRSPNDAVQRIHAFRHLPGRNLAVVVAMSEEEAMQPATIWRHQAHLFAGSITALLAGLALVLVHATRLARRREASIAENRAILATSNAQLEVARAVSAAKSEQLEATLASMSDGVSMVDAHMCLVEWNRRFPEMAGAIVSNEIRTALNALLNTFQLMGDSGLSPAQQALLVTMQQAGDALAGLVNDVLEPFQMETGKLPIRPSLFELHPFLKSSAEKEAGAQAIGQALSAPATVEIGDRPRRRTPRTRILLIEDIAANQFMTATLLRREGHHVDIAGSGPAAIRAIEAAPYDVVFMDTVMSGMNGQEATQIIRTLPEPARSISIVALTANVDPKDEALFSAAGMNSILAKPIALNELLDVLHRHVWSAPIAAKPPVLQVPPVVIRHAGTVRPKEFELPATTSNGPNSVPILATARINELRTNLPPATFARLMEECLVDMDHQLPALCQAMVAGMPETISAHAHALAGMAAGYGMAAMEARLRTIMAAAQEGEMAPLGPAMIAALEADFTMAASTLREMLRTEVMLTAPC